MDKVYLLYQDGELLEIFDSEKKAEHAKYSGKYFGHWDSFEIEEWEVSK